MHVYYILVSYQLKEDNEKYLFQVNFETTCTAMLAFRDKKIYDALLKI